MICHAIIFGDEETEIKLRSQANQLDWEMAVCHLNPTYMETLEILRDQIAPIQVNKVIK